MAVDQVSRAREAWPILVDLARRGTGPITYKELCEPLGYHHRAAGAFLSVIQIWCKENGHPPLQSLVVSKMTGLPGYGYQGSLDPARHAQDMADVRNTSWPSTAPF